MAFNGSGTFVRSHNWQTDKTNSVKITASRMDTEDDGFATGLSNAICRDGQSTITANIPFNGKKATGLGDATAATDALNQQAGDARYVRTSVETTFERSVHVVTADIGINENVDNGISLYDTASGAPGVFAQARNSTASLHRMSKVGDLGAGFFTNMSYNGSTIGTISHTASAVAYNTTSDAVLKDNIADVDALDAVAAVKAGRPRSFEYKAEPGVLHYGFVAQEMAEICPGAVIPADGDAPAMMDYSKTTPWLWAGLARVTERMEAIDGHVGAAEPDDYRRRRKRAYYALSPESDALHSIGDTLDALFKQVEVLRVAVGAPRHAEFDDKLTKIQAIKVAHPKP